MIPELKKTKIQKSTWIEKEIGVLNQQEQRNKTVDWIPKRKMESSNAKKRDNWKEGRGKRKETKTIWTPKPKGKRQSKNKKYPFDLDPKNHLENMKKRKKT